MKKEVQGMFQGAIDTLHQKIFWKIQAFNLFMIVKRIVYYVLITLSLIFVGSITSQGLRLSSFQRESIALSIYFIVLVIVLIKMFKNIFRGTESEGMLEVLKAIMNSMIWTFMFYIAFSINLTSYEKISNLILSWFVIAFLFKLNEIMIFRKLSKQVRSGKKSDWFDLVEQQVTSKFMNGRLSGSIFSETYKLRYSKISFKVNRVTIAEDRIVSLEGVSVGTTGKGKGVKK